MESKLNDMINQSVVSLANFILKKHPNINKDVFDHKIKELFKIKNNSIIDTINKQTPIIKVKKSPFSNYILIMDKYEDIGSIKFVLDIDSQTIIGTENSEGLIEPLQKSFIELCHKYKLRYKVPFNLNIGNESDDDVILNEIEELGLNHEESDTENEA